MDTTQLINQAKARFNHNSAKAYLKEKYHSKLIVADQGGLWTATPELITFLHVSSQESIVIIDDYKNPIRVNRQTLLEKLSTTYNNVMTQWNTEWIELEKKR
jgi:hypothetical protein